MKRCGGFNPVAALFEVFHLVLSVVVRAECAHGFTGGVLNFKCRKPERFGKPFVSDDTGKDRRRGGLVVKKVCLERINSSHD